MKTVLLALLLIAACRDSGPTGPNAAWRHVAHGSLEARDDAAAVVLPDTALKPYLPERILGRAGARPRGSVTHIGPRALSEATRTYPGGEGQTDLKLADARFEPHATEAIRNLVDGPEAGDAERLVLPGAVGYARYDEGDRLAQAQVVIGGRFIATATVEQARDAQAAVAALRELDTLALSKLAGSSN